MLFKSDSIQRATEEELRIVQSTNVVYDTAGSHAFGSLFADGAVQEMKILE